MNKKTILIIAAAIIVLVYGIYLIKQSLANRLPASFTITIHEDNSSSGGDRYKEKKFTFADSALVSGIATYYQNAGGGCTENCNHKDQCTIANNQWQPVTSTQDDCQIAFGDVPTKKSLEADIKSGVLKNQKDCSHLAACYEVTQ